MPVQDTLRWREGAVSEPRAGPHRLQDRWWFRAGDPRAVNHAEAAEVDREGASSLQFGRAHLGPEGFGYVRARKLGKRFWGWALAMHQSERGDEEGAAHHRPQCVIWH